MAAEWKAEPSVSMNISQNDNIHMSSTNEESATGYTLAPGLSLSGQEINWNVLLDANLRAVRYSGVEDVDSNNGSLSFLNKYSTERQSWRLNASYVKNTTLDTSPETQSADAGIGEDQRDQKDTEIAPGWSWSVSRLQQIDVSYTLAHSETEGTSTIASSEYDTNKVSLGYSYQLAENKDLSVFASIEKFDSNTTSFEYEQPALYVQYNHKLNESDKITFLVGAWKLDAVFHNELIGCDFVFAGQCVLNPVYGDVENTNNGTLYDVSYFTYGELTDLTFGINSTVIPNRYGGAQQKDLIKFTLLYRISPRHNFNFYMDAYETETIEGNILSAAQDRKQFRVKPSYIWRLNKDWVLGASYQFVKHEYTLSGLESDSNAFYINLNMTWPRLASTY
ncbi:MAG TPA: hypothetical protein VIQ03_04650 [Gammaproteobacteria bacterium]